MDAVDRAGAFAVAGLLALAAVAVAGLGDPSPAPEPADPAAELVEAWERSRTSTYRAVGTFERTGPDGASMSVPVEVAQRPPDRLLRQFGEVTGRRGRRPLQCPAPAGDGEATCTLGPPGRTFEEEVAAEVDAFRSLVSGLDPLYEVAPAGPGCWRMTRTRPDPRSGFGVEAVVCADDATGAIRSVTVDHGSVSERTRYHEISHEVADADLEPDRPAS